MVKRFLNFLVLAALMAPPLRAHEITALSQVIVVEKEDRLGVYYSNAATPGAERGLDWGIADGWDVFINTEVKRAVNAGVKTIFVTNPFGVRTYIQVGFDADNKPIYEAHPHDNDTAWQFTQYTDAVNQDLESLEDFVPIWRSFIEANPHVKIIMGIGCPRRDLDTTLYLSGLTTDEAARAIVVTEFGRSFNDLESYASDPQKLQSIWGEYIWPNVIPIFQAGVRTVYFDAASELHGTLPSITPQMVNKLRYPHLRVPGVDQKLIDVVGQEPIEVIIETRPDDSPQKTYSEINTMIWSDVSYEDMHPVRGGGDRGTKLFDAEAGTIYRRGSTEHDLNPDEKNAFGESRNIILAGHIAMVYPPDLYEKNQNAYNIDTVDGWFEALGLNAIPTNIKLRVDNPTDDMEYIITRRPRHGTLVHDSTEPAYYWKYTPRPGYNGPDSFVFKARHGADESNEATVFINPSNHENPVDEGTSSDEIEIGLFKNVLHPDHAKFISVPVTVKKSVEVKIHILDRHGRIINKLVDEQLSLGERDVLWDGTDLSKQPVASGLYLLRVEFEDKVETKKIVVVR